jgi:hypothetical protein
MSDINKEIHTNNNTLNNKNYKITNIGLVDYGHKKIALVGRKY